MPSLAIQHTLPHAGMALVCDDARVDSPTSATGFFFVNPDDPRVVGHFDVMMGALIGEFTHQTAAFLILTQEKGYLPMLKRTQMTFHEAVFPGDQLTCDVMLEERQGREATFNAVVHSKRGEDEPRLVADITFTGTIVPKRALDMMRRQAKAGMRLVQST